MHVEEWDLIQEKAKLVNFRVMLNSQKMAILREYQLLYQHDEERLSIINEVIDTKYGRI